MRFPIRRKLVLAIGIPLFAAYAATSWILVHQLRARSLERFERVATDRIMLLAARADAPFESAAKAARVAAAVLSSSTVAAEWIGPALVSALEGEPSITRMRAYLGDGGDSGWVATRKEGGIELAGPLPIASFRAVGEAPWPKTVGSGCFSAVYDDPGLGGPAATCAVPLVRDGVVAGAILADVAFARLAQPLAEAGTGERRVLVVARDGAVLYSSTDALSVGVNLFGALSGAKREDLDEIGLGIRNAEVGIARAPGLLRSETVWFGHAPLPSVDASVVAAVPESIALAFEQGQMRIGLGILTVGLVLILGAVLAASAAITRPISRLAEAVADLGHGDLDARVSRVESSDEIGELARSFDRMVEDLKRHVEALQRETAARESMLSELKVARQIQTALLPKRLPAGPGFSIRARNLPARHVAGDFYDAFAEGGRIVFLVADVSGKGLPSALFMAVSRIVLRRALTGCASLSEAIREVNESLEAEGVGSMYLTLFVASCDPATGSLRYVNAGHPPPWRVSSSGTASPLGEVSGGPVGLLPRRRFEEREERLGPGDRIVVFTDGVPEARRGDEEFFGDERLAALMRAGPIGENADALCDRVVAAVEAFQDGNLADDVTVLVLAREG